ncbi:MAG: biopolymer transporter ExbD [Candidatus Margulisbacteria bacterium]|jgi:biopolymer transport protein ExbD|nr:biopolymer transporter ExbD [Candidatus Margulisiibacteriota bacterium]
MSHRSTPHIDLVPLLDVVFLLLLFFVCAAFFQAGALPAGLSGQNGNSKEYQKIVIAADKITGLDTLNSLPVLIEVRPDVVFVRVREVLHRLQEQHITNVNFAL